MSWMLLRAGLCFIAVQAGAGVCAADEVIRSEQFGAVRLDFGVGESKGFVILATKPAPDGTKPWIWYAPAFIGRHPDESHTWMAEQWLDAGFAIGGVDVGESYGSPAGTAAYTAYYEHVVREYDLDSKPCLLAQSRGGLMLLNWATAYPSRVRCIAGIYTVCNLDSYPGVEKASGAYGMDVAGLRSRLRDFNPVDRVRSLAEARVPMLFVHGDSDKVVPIERNAEALVKRSVELGGNATVIVVPGKGHEVCPEFFRSEALTQFLLTRGSKPVREE